jgi:hypothetical protein
MDLFRFTQAFRNFFFLKAGIAFPLMNVALIAGAKVKTFFETRKFIFGKFSSLF